MDWRPGNSGLGIEWGWGGEEWWVVTVKLGLLDGQEEIRPLTQ